MIARAARALGISEITEMPSLRVAAVAALLMVAAAAGLGALFLFGTDSLLFFQPSEKPASVEAFVAPTNDRPGAAIAHFTLDTAFVISFTLVFVGLYVLTRARAPQFSAFALGAGILTGVLDAVENAVYWVYAMRADVGVALSDPDLVLVSVLTNLKLVGFFTTYLTFALVLPRRDRLERLATGWMLLAPTIGLLSMGVREIAAIRPVLFASPAIPLLLLFARGRLATAA